MSGSISKYDKVTKSQPGFCDEIPDLLICWVALEESMCGWGSSPQVSLGTDPGVALALISKLSCTA